MRLVVRLVMRLIADYELYEQARSCVSLLVVVPLMLIVLLVVFKRLLAQLLVQASSLL